MKKNVLWQTLACTLALASTGVLCSCEKEDADILNRDAGYENQASKSKPITINYSFSDSTGKTWNIRGTVSFNGLKVSFDLTLTDPDGNKYHFKGGATIKDLTTLTIGDVTVTCTDDNGNPVTISNLQELLESAVKEANDVSSSKSASSAITVCGIQGICTDDNGDTVVLSNLNELLNAAAQKAHDAQSNEAKSAVTEYRNDDPADSTGVPEVITEFVRAAINEGLISKEDLQ